MLFDFIAVRTPWATLVQICKRGDSAVSILFCYFLFCWVGWSRVREPMTLPTWCWLRRPVASQCVIYLTAQRPTSRLVTRSCVTTLKIVLRFLRHTPTAAFVSCVPKPDAKRVITFSNNNDFVSFRQHVFKVTGREVELQECGPRFELQLYQVKLGTLDQKPSEHEWVLYPYMNSAKKRRVL
ncbi:hypothetical protein PsorP6_004004 [Peronosclerospora sorghi]|uniref:Uncharacterized protein n=1 Tax=Peronosclerospora sorghi TaxID=230839 RepID=A0ACC0VK89_9STRA|nr:hypothetical protein PsorP6_004004 [Peronosclerospora sorghi]